MKNDALDAMRMSQKALGKEMDRVARLIVEREKEWIENELAKLLPPDIFLASYGNDVCKQRVSQYCLDHNISQIHYPDGAIGIKKGEEVISILPPVRFTFDG